VFVLLLKSKEGKEWNWGWREALIGMIFILMKVSEPPKTKDLFEFYFLLWEIEEKMKMSERDFEDKFGRWGRQLRRWIVVLFWKCDYSLFGITVKTVIFGIETTEKLDWFLFLVNFFDFWILILVFWKENWVEWKKKRGFIVGIWN
jgi:hypothetical protein